MSNYAISRIASYKYGDAGGVLKEALRKLPNYDNPDCDPSKSYLNVELVPSVLNGMTIEKYIIKYREENDIKGRFNTNAANPKNATNCLCQCLFTASRPWLEARSREEQIEYFDSCLKFFKQEFPSVHIVSAIIHFDETTPHMHITYIPTIQRPKKKTGEMETIFSTTHLMPGKDFFHNYQERFFDYISARYDGFDRGESTRRNLTVEEFKELSHFFGTSFEEKFASAVEEIEHYKEIIAKQKRQIDYLAAEVEKLNAEKKWYESIPMLKEFFQRIRKMKVENIEAVLQDCLDIVADEEKYIAQQEATVDDIIAIATKRSDKANKENKEGLSEHKKNLVAKLFGRKENGEFGL